MAFFLAYLEMPYGDAGSTERRLYYKSLPSQLFLAQYDRHERDVGGYAEAGQRQQGGRAGGAPGRAQPRVVDDGRICCAR